MPDVSYLLSCLFTFSLHVGQRDFQLLGKLADCCIGPGHSGLIQPQGLNLLPQLLHIVL